MGDVERDGRIPDLGLHCIVERMFKSQDSSWIVRLVVRLTDLGRGGYYPVR
jgi:hypothetical protein